MGPSGPPIPEPVTFQVYPFPLKRRPILVSQKEHFKFITSGPDDMYVKQCTVLRYHYSRLAMYTHVHVCGGVGKH